MRKCWLLLPILVLVTGPSGRAENPLTIVANKAAFYDPADSATYVEIYFSLYRDQLGFIGSDTSRYQYAGVSISARVFDSSGRSIDSAATHFLTQVSDSAKIHQPGVRLFDMLPLKISPGHYRVNLTARDDVSGVSGGVLLDFQVPSFRVAGLTASDIEMAYDLVELTTSSISGANPRLIKEGYLVVPNPSGALQWKKDTLLHAYSELYGLSSGGSFVVKYMVKDSSGNEIRDLGETRYENPGATAVLARHFAISDLLPGQYYLVLEAIDLNTKQQTASSMKFSLLDLATLDQEVASEDAQLMVNMAWYHLSEAEKIRIKALNSEGKRNFVKQFWREMDDDPSTPVNPVYDDAVRRFAYANEQFSTHADKSNGWKTDRGRVYIMYGPPDSESEESVPGTSYPMIRWDYFKIEGGVIFIFVNDEKAGAADYRLVHSTHPRERQNEYWMDKYRQISPEDDWQHGDDGR